MIHENILQLQVSVYDVLLVQVIQRRQNLRCVEASTIFTEISIYTIIIERFPIFFKKEEE